MRRAPTRFRLHVLAGLVALLPACTAPTESEARGPLPACGLGPGAMVPVPDGEELTVAGTLNGQPVRLDIDTGLGLTSLLPGFVERMNLPLDARRQSGTIQEGRTVLRQNVLVTGLRTGSHEWGGRSLAVRPILTSGGPPRFDGMVAADLLRDTELELDLPARRVTVFAQRNCRAEGPPWASGAVRVPMELPNNGVPVVTVRVNGQEVRALIQSGNNRTVLSRGLADRLGLGQAQATGVRTRSHGPEMRVGRGEEYRLDELALGEDVVRGMPVVVSATGTASTEPMVLGRDWLARRKVWLSYHGRRLYLARTGG